MELLDDGELEEYLAEMDGWELIGAAISRRFEFEDFPSAVQFVDALVEPAETMTHHPGVAISWNEVTVTIVDHDAGGVTMKDLQLAEEISALVD